MATQELIPNKNFASNGGHSSFNQEPLQFSFYKTGTLSMYKMQKDKKDEPIAIYDFIPEDDFQTTLQFELDNLYDKVMSKTGLPGQAVNLLATAFDDADGYSTRYRNIPAQKSFSCTINDSVTLKFRYGLYRDYNAKTEVVTPICTLIKEFAPTLQYKEGGKNNYLVKGPYASTARILKGAGNSEGLIADLKNKNESAISKVINAFETVVDNSLEDTNMKYLNIRIGKFTWMYLVPKSISWKFDTSNVDENGNPMSGTLTLSGLQFIYAPVQIEGTDNAGFFNFNSDNANKNIIGDLSGVKTIEEPGDKPTQ